MAGTITDYIKKDLQHYLQTGQVSEECLTLEGLAARYKVSTTPVRLAVRDLIDEQTLLKEDNGRLKVNPEARLARRIRSAGEPSLLPPDPSHAEALLTKQVVQWSLENEEKFLREEATARRFGIGRTVLRQLLHRLAGKGLIEHVPRRGWHVHAYNESEMTAYLDVRVSLELKALDLARPHLAPADLERMLRGNTPASGSRDDRLDNDLHQYLIDRSGNRYIKQFFEQYGAYHTELFAFAAPEAKVVRQMARQHREILRALLAKDWRGAKRVLAHHIRSQGAIVKRLLALVHRDTLDSLPSPSP